MLAVPVDASLYVDGELLMEKLPTMWHKIVAWTRYSDMEGPEDRGGHYFHVMEDKINELVDKVNELEEKLKENK